MKTKRKQSIWNRMFSSPAKISLLMIAVSAVVFVSSVDAVEVDTITPEIKELAYSLNYDPVKIYEYVCNEIDFTVYYGFSKGATRTLLTKSGNDHDQAALLTALLKAAAQQPNTTIQDVEYCEWKSTLWETNPDEEYTLCNWMGVNDDLMYNANNQIIGSEVIKVIQFNYGSIYSGWEGLNNNTIRRLHNYKRFGVKITMLEDGQTVSYYLDPALKHYDESTGEVDDLVNNAAWLNLSDQEVRNALYTAAGITDGGDPDQIPSMNEAGVNQQLAVYAAAVSDKIKTDYSSASVDDLLKHRKIRKKSIEMLPEGMPDGYTGDLVTYSTAPETMANTITVRHGKLATQQWGLNKTFYLAEIGARRLTLEYANNNGSIVAQLWLSGDPQPVCVETVPDGVTYANQDNADLQVQINVKGGAQSHQLLTRDRDLNRDVNDIFAIWTGFESGDNGGLLGWQQKNLQQVSSSSGTDLNKQQVRETLHVMGSMFNQEIACLTKLQERMLGIRELMLHCNLGITDNAYATRGDIIRNSYCQKWKCNDTELDSASALRVITSSIMEHCIYNELFDKEDAGVSTIRGLIQANRDNNPMLKLDRGNYSAILSQLAQAGYSTVLLNNLVAALNAGAETILVPENPSISANDWNGSVYLAYGSPENSYSPFTSGIEGLNGVFGDEEIDYATAFMNHYLPELMDRSSDFGIMPYTKSDPIDMKDGAYLVNKQDLTLGSRNEPMGLRLNRTYNSGDGKTRGEMGYGWEHSYDIHVRENVDAGSLFASQNPQDILPLWVAFQCGAKVVSQNATAKEMMLATLIMNWGMDLMLQKQVMITQGQHVRRFVLGADGVYHSQPGDTGQLFKENGLYYIMERDGSRMDFNSDLKIATWKDIDGNTMTFSYNNGKLQTVADCFGHSLTFSYTDTANPGLVTRVTDSSTPARFVDYSYDANGNLLEVTDVMGQEWSYTYNDDHRVVEYKDPDDNRLIYNYYDLLGRVTNQLSPEGFRWDFYFNDICSVGKDPEGGLEYYYYDDKGRLLKHVDEEGAVIEKQYDVHNQTTWEKDAMGHESVYQYDNHQNLTNVVTALATNSMDYNDQHLLISKVDPNGNTMSFEYDTERHLKKITDPIGYVKEMSYDDNGLPLNMKSYADLAKTVCSETTFVYDDYGNLIRQTKSDAGTSSYGYNHIGDLMGATNALGHDTQYVYNKNRQLVLETDALGHTSSNRYDVFGHVSAVTDKRGHTTTNTYDLSGNLMKVAYPNGAIITNIYNKCYHLTAIKDAKGNIAYYENDKTGRQVKETDRLGRVTTYTYDANGNLLVVTNALLDATRYTYDELNRVVAITNALLGATHTLYDRMGNITNVIDALGHKTVQKYDALNRVVKTTYPNQSTKEVQYDGLGRVIAEKDRRDNWSRYGYDLAGRLVVATNALGYTVTNVYDLIGALKEQIDAEGRSTHYTYDKVGQVEEVLNPDASTMKYEYDAAGNLTAQVESA